MKRWVLAGMCIIGLGLAAIGAHSHHRAEVYELMHESQHCHQVALRRHMNPKACMHIDDELFAASNSYF